MRSDTPALRAAVRRVMVRLIPFLFLMYVIAFLDRVNIGFAKEEFQAHAGISEAAYALGAGLFFIGYALFEVPSNLIMTRVGARWWMCRIMVTWGLISAAMSLVNSESLFYLLRFLLGVAEAGFFPGVILYITYWVPHAYRARCNALFYFGIPLASVLGAPLSGALLELDGAAGFLGWQWMFAVEGLIACVVGVWAFFYLDNSPADARWLTPDQRTALQTALDAEAESKRGPHRLLASLVDRRVLYFCLIYFLIQCSVYGMTFYLPTQVSEAVGSEVGLLVGLVTAIPWTVALVVNIVVNTAADRLAQPKKRFVAAACVAVGSVGIAASAAFSNPVLAIAGLSEGVITPSTTFGCGGSGTFFGRRFRCWKREGHGSVDVDTALKVSCDVFFYNTGMKLGVNDGVDKISCHVMQYRRDMGQKALVRTYRR